MKLLLFHLLVKFRCTLLFIKLQQVIMSYQSINIMLALYHNNWTMKTRFVYYLQIWFHRVFYWTPEIALRLYTNVFDED